MTQSSLFEPASPMALSSSTQWLEGVLFGQVAVSLCMIAVAVVGFVMLSGQLPVRRGMWTVLGCFVLLGAPVIAAGFVAGGSEFRQAPDRPPPIALEASAPREALPPADRDPSAGASLRRE